MHLSRTLLLSCLFLASNTDCFAKESSPVWDTPRAIREDTILFGEDPLARQVDPSEPTLKDKSYPWYWLEKGNNFLIAGEDEKAAVSFSKCYAAGGATAVLSGFKLIETYEKMGRLDEALSLLGQLRQNYLMSNQEFSQAQAAEMGLLDKKRKKGQAPLEAPYNGRTWLLKISIERMNYVLDAMEVLREHGIPIQRSAQEYVFRLDEHFIASPEQPAENAPETLAGIIYEDDPQARVAIDRWRLNPTETLVSTPSILAHANKTMTGADWIRMTHPNKMNYVLGAMEVLKNQSIPMKKTPYAYVYVLDEFFTENPELPASDSVVALASALYQTEKEARDVLEALRLR